jgi:peptide/nickel transport system permease protein
MQTYLLRRMLQAIPLLFVLSMLLFALVRSAPGGPLAQTARNPNISQEQLQQLRAQLGLDQPLYVQYWQWLQGILVHGDLGESIKTHRPVAEMISERIPNTLLLIGLAFLLTLFVAIPVGAYSALRQYSWFDYLLTTITFAGQSVPIYWMGLMFILIFYVWLDNPFTGQPLLPVGGMYTPGVPRQLGDLLWHMILPVGTLCLAWIAWYSRFFRASMLEVLHADYLRTACAKGLSPRRVTYVHALRNGIMPLITLIALDLPAMFAGALFIETIFAWPGMGRLFWEAARGRDYPVLLGIIIINAGLILFCNLIADLLYGWLDPRVRHAYR